MTLRYIIFLFIPIYSLFAQPYGLTERIPNTSFLINNQGDTLVDMELRRVFSNLTFSQPVQLIYPPDGTDRIFVVERRGVISVFPNRVDVTEARTFMDISTTVNSGPSEAGLLSMAFHPQFPDSNKFYVYYTYGNLFSRISEFYISADIDSADASSERILLEVRQPYGNHNGGQIAFGSDGYLYIGLGDGGSAGDPLNSGQNLKTLLGSFLRIDVIPSDTLEYTIPNNNPFYANTSGWRQEIWAYGLRNPWRFSFDRHTGDLWTGDVGQGEWEEVDLIEKGKNYGWRLMEGFHCYNPASCDTSGLGLTLPVTEYSHSIGKSITGGFVYRGSRLARLDGVYLYGDFVTRKIWGLKYEDGHVIENKIIATSPAGISAFGEDDSGEVYVVGYDGRIFVFDEKEGNQPASTIPQTISESGLFSNIDSLIPAPGLIPYSVNAPFWSDGAYKTRIIALPDTQQIQFSENGFWVFPANSVIVKNFFLEIIKGDPSSRKIIETRFLVRRSETEIWDGFSYLWDDEQNDAVLLDTSVTRTFLISDGDSLFTQHYYYPSPSECATCHNPAAGYVLGLRTAQINKPHWFTQSGDSVQDNQLRSYNNIELFTEDIGENYHSFPKMTNPYDTSYALENRARSYLDVNCANCHRPEGTGRTNMDLHYNIPLEAAHIINEIPTLGDLGIEGSKRIMPGAPDSSVVFLRMLDTTEYRMPPLGSLVVDAAGADLIHNWIDSLGIILSIDEMTESQLIKHFQLYPAYPNPFNPRTKISFTVPTPAHVQLTIYDINGRMIRTLLNNYVQPGRYETTWDARNVASGLYFVTMRTADFSQSQKLIVLQ